MAISNRIPFGRFLNVGGNREKREKNIVWPEAAAPSTVTVKTLAVFGAEAVGLNDTDTWVQTLGAAVTAIVPEARVDPVLDLSATVKGPLKVDPGDSL